MHISMFNEYKDLEVWKCLQYVFQTNNKSSEINNTLEEPSDMCLSVQKVLVSKMNTGHRTLFQVGNVLSVGSVLCYTVHDYLN